MKNNDEYKSDRELLQEALKDLKDIKQNVKDVIKPPANRLDLADNFDLMKLFKCDKKSLANWSKEGLLKPIKIRNRVYYKMKDVEAMVEEQLKKE